MKNILVIDDSGATRLMVRQMLRETNCRVFESAGADQLFDSALDKEFSLQNLDLVMLDLYLGETDGFQLLKNFTARHPGLPVIVMSVERRRESIMKCIELGAKDYIIKPFNKEILLSRINRFFKIMVRDDIESDLKMLESVLMSEIDRTIRVKGPLSVLFFKILDAAVDQNSLYNLQENARKALRRIDTVLVYKRFLIMILPLAGDAGLQTVRNKLDKIFSGAGLYSDRLYEKCFVFPADVKNKELIHNFEVSKIKDLVMQVFMNMR